MRPHTTSPQQQRQWKKRLEKVGTFMAVFILNVAIFLLIATAVIWHFVAPQTDEPMTFVKVPPQAKPKPPLPPPSHGGESAKSNLDPTPVVVPPPTSMAVVVTTNPTPSFSMETFTTTTMSTAISTANLPSGGGLDQGTSGGGIPSSDLSTLDANLPLGGQMSKLLFQLPCGNDGACVKTDEHHITMHLADEDVHVCNLLVRGIVEQGTYTGGVTTNTYLNTGGTPNTGVYNVYKLSVDKPPQTYYLNSGTSGIRQLFAINYTMKITVKDGSNVTLFADSKDLHEIPNYSGATKVPSDNADFPIAVKQPYQGQFIQVDAVSMDN